MFHQDELVRNYLAQASQRYAYLRVQQHLQSDELERVLSPETRLGESRVSSATKSTRVSHSLPAFERKNTLLLTGKSKFYTMSYEDHCHTPSPVVHQPSTSAEQYCRIAADNVSSKTSISASSQKSNSVGENSPHISSRASECETLSFCIAEPFSENPHSWPYSDTNHNSIFSSYKPRCQGAESCPHPVWPEAGNICAACFQAKRYSAVVQYPTAATKL